MTKLVLKCGDIEIEYEGAEEFLIKELPKLLTTVTALRAPRAAPPADTKAVNPPPPGGGESVSTIAQKLSVKSAPDLIIASALSLSRGGTTTFSKKQLRDGIRTATGFFKASYINNFDNSVLRLVKAGRLHHSGGTNYSLPDTEKSALEARLK